MRQADGRAGSGESESYDANGNPLAQTVNGQTTRFTYDDGDRLTSQQFPYGHTDSYAYTGLALRLLVLHRRHFPGAPVLWDGHAVYTPGQSENRGGASAYPAFDRLGNLWTVNVAGHFQSSYTGHDGLRRRLGAGRGEETT